MSFSLAMLETYMINQSLIIDKFRDAKNDLEIGIWVFCHPKAEVKDK